MRIRILIILLIIVPFNIFSNDIHSLLDRAEDSLYRQDYYSAVESYKEALKLNPNDISANRGLSDSFFMLSEYEEALIHIQRCIGLNKSNLEFHNLKGRVLTALKRYKDAEDEYNSVLKIEMYNVGAKSGLAELRVVAGDLKGSLYDFKKILKLSPESRRLLLSLVVLYDSQEDYTNSDKLIQKAIRYYPMDPIVLEGAVRHYMATGSYRGAALYMDELSSISENSSIILLHAELLLNLKEYDEALLILTEYMKLEKDNPYAYYIASLILDTTGEKDKALSLIKRGLDLKPDEELYRFYSEMIMDDLYILKDDRRTDYSLWYYEQGKTFENRYYYEKAKNYYLRGMDLDPFSKKLRLAYADVLKKMGYQQKYITELELVIEQNSESEDIQEILMIQKSLPAEKIYEKWGNESFNNDSLLSISVYINLINNESHLYSSKVIRYISGRFLSGKSKYRIENIDSFTGKFSEAFSGARDSGSDFFITLDYFEGRRTFSLQVTLHLTRSGRAIKSFNYLKTGNNRIFNCFESLADDINSFLPIIGTITDIKGEELLIDLGLVHNLTNDMNFDVVKKGSIELVSTDPYLAYDEDNHLGHVVIKNVGESMSDGLFTANSSFNLLNIGDNVLFIENEDIGDLDIGDKVITDRELIEQLLQVN